MNSKPATVGGENSGDDDSAFQLAFNNKFNEQFNREYVQQQQLLQQNPRFLRTRQSIEVERRDLTAGPSDNAPYPLYQENTLRPTTVRKQAFGHQNVECNLLNQLFLSPDNIEYLQQRIRSEVYKASNQQTVIDRQSERELAIIMRSIYFTYGKNLPTHIREQIRELNDLVVQECVSRVMSEIQGHVRYLFDASTQPMPLSLPQSMSIKGQKILPSVTSVYNM